LNKRKDALRAMMLPIATPDVSEERHTRTPVKSGSLKAMGLSLQGLSDEADEARELREQIAAGSHVVELDPLSIDPSFIRDRLDDDEGPDFEELQASIAEHGQQVPILVRPSGESEGRYQVAYGHRRLAALRRIGRPVKAIVRHLTDEQLVVAQGKENIERRDLSFIERALFAARLEDHGFDRSAVMASLSLHKGNLSTMVMVARALPEQLIVAIGPAPKIGRPRWEHLAELLRQGNDAWHLTINKSDFGALDSNVRFIRVLSAMTPRQKVDTAHIVKDAAGCAVARVKNSRDRVSLTIDEKSTNAFGAFLVEQIPDLYAAFRRRVDA
jgi:ParB family transcriptional regulator, chromosome partitioning protein